MAYPENVASESSLLGRLSGGDIDTQDFGLRMFVSEINSPSTCARANIKDTTNCCTLLTLRSETKPVVQGHETHVMDQV